MATADEYELKVTGKTELDWQEGNDIKLDDVVTVVMTGVISTTSDRYSKEGDLIRTDTLKLEKLEVVPMGQVAKLRSVLDTGVVLPTVAQEIPGFEFDDEEEELSV